MKDHIKSMKDESKLEVEKETLKRKLRDSDKKIEALEAQIKDLMSKLAIPSIDVLNTVMRNVGDKAERVGRHISDPT